MVIGIERQRQNYLQMIARKEAQKKEKPDLIKQNANSIVKFTGLKLDETKKICDLDLRNGTRLNPLNPSAKVLTEEELAEIRRKQEEEQPKSTLVDGVEFTYKELYACENFVNKVTSSFRGGSLNYNDYAKMGIASSIINTYAKENLNDEQAKVVNNSVENFFNHFVQKHINEHKKDPYFYIDNTEGVGSTGELNKYYAFKCKWSVQQAEDFKSYIKSTNLSEYYKQVFCSHADYAIEVGGTMQCASNAEHAQKIKSLFQNMDIMDEDSMKNAFQEYEILMTPVYKAAGLQNSHFDTGVSDFIENDIKDFVSQISSGKAAINTSGTKVNIVA